MNHTPTDDTLMICQRAAAIWTLLLDFRHDCDSLAPDQLSRRCVDIVEAMKVVEERIAARKQPEDDD